MLILCLISLRYYGGKKQGNSEKTTYHILCMTNDRNVAYFIFKCFFFINKVVSRIRLRLLNSRLVGVILDYSQTLIFSQITLSEMDHTGSTSFQKKKKNHQNRFTQSKVLRYSPFETPPYGSRLKNGNITYKHLIRYQRNTALSNLTTGR